MPQEAFCPIHGPYDASLGACPYCQREGRGAAQAGGVPLGEEETRVYQGPVGGAADVDEMPTQIGPSPYVGAGPFDDEETIIRRRGAWGMDDDLDMTMVEHKVEGTLGWLIIKKGGRRGRIFKLKDETTLGRKHADIVLNDPKVSALHAKIALIDGQFVIADVLSRNGTYVNGERIKEQRVLKENDEIKIGDTVLVLKVLPEDET